MFWGCFDVGKVAFQLFFFEKFFYNLFASDLKDPPKSVFDGFGSMKSGFFVFFVIFMFFEKVRFLHVSIPEISESVKVEASRMGE